MRILVTGSRTWRDGQLVRTQLDHGLSVIKPDDTLTVVHGACKSGADSYADAWGRWHTRNSGRVAVEPHPAYWEGPCRATCQPGHRRPDKRGWDVCPAAGFYRNEEMVQLGADVVLAFIDNESKGATHCATYAESQGLAVLFFRTPIPPSSLF